VIWGSGEKSEGGRVEVLNDKLVGRRREYCMVWEKNGSGLIKKHKNNLKNFFL
jgi:hypothetical protein